MVINYTREEGVEAPEYAVAGSSCVDLRATEDVSIPNLGSATVPTGLRVSIPVGYEGQVRSRSGLAARDGVFVLNSPGTVDHGYTGEIKVVLANLSDRFFFVKKGDRIAQLAICPVVQAEYVEVDSLETTVRGDGGFGSTGVK